MVASEGDRSLQNGQPFATSKCNSLASALGALVLGLARTCVHSLENSARFGHFWVGFSGLLLLITAGDRLITWQLCKHYIQPLVSTRIAPEWTINQTRN